MNFPYNHGKLNEYVNFDTSITIYHNFNFPYEDIESVLGSLFGNYYGDKGLRDMINTVEHIWCAYDMQINRCVGCALVACEPNNNTLYIKLFGVQTINQGQGVGTRLLKALIEWAQRKGYSAIILHTQINNYKAIGLYEKVGFRKQLHLENFFHSQTPVWSLLSGEPDAYQMIIYL